MDECLALWLHRRYDLGGQLRWQLYLDFPCQFMPAVKTRIQAMRLVKQRTEIVSKIVNIIHLEIRYAIYDIRYTTKTIENRRKTIYDIQLWMTNEWYICTINSLRYSRYLNIRKYDMRKTMYDIRWWMAVEWCSMYYEAFTMYNIRCMYACHLDSNLRYTIR